MTGVSWPRAGWPTMPFTPGLWPPATAHATVFAEYRDLAANVLAVSDAITVEYDGPEGSFTINGRRSLHGSAPRDLEQRRQRFDALEMRFSNDGVSWPEGW